MKLKILFFSLLLFLLALPIMAIENFDSYSNGYNMDNESNWTYNYGDNLQVKSSNPYSSPNSMAHSDGNGSLNTDYNHGEDFDKFQMAIRDDGADFGKWDIYFKDGTSVVGKITMTNNAVNWDGQQDMNCGYLTYSQYSILYIEFTATQVRCKLDENAWTGWYNHSYVFPDIIQFDHNNDPSNTYFDDMSVGDEAIIFEITSPEQDEGVINDDWITVSGTCPTNGVNQIGFTNDCLDYSSIEYTTDCTDNTFTAAFYKSGITDVVVARDKDSISTDCVDYDDLVDFITVRGVDVIEGYPDEWHFNYDYYDDYDININSPVFELPSLTLPQNTTSTVFSFSFIYPSSELANLTFNVKQYDENGDLLNSAYHNQSLSSMADTNNHLVSLTASSSTLYYAVQMFSSGELKRQYSFGVFVSDFDYIGNPADLGYLFPRLVEMLKTKVIFNYFFSFYDGFYDMFNASSTVATSTALDITFKSVSGDGEYDLDIPIFSASNSIVQSFASGIRPYVSALLWLGFAIYVIFRITHLFSDNE